MRHSKVSNNKRVIGILTGGRSAEHEVSLRSAQTVVDHLNKTKYEPVVIIIDRLGRWRLQKSDRPVLLNPSAGQGELLDEKTGQKLAKLDVLFPVLHGPYGEDGSIQGLAKLADLPCVGAGILGSAVGMDKDVMKRLLTEAGMPVCPYEVIRKSERSQQDRPQNDWSLHDRSQQNQSQHDGLQQDRPQSDRLQSDGPQSDRSLFSYHQLKEKLGSTMYIKPANMGSSVGVSKVDSKEEFDQAVNAAFAYDQKILVEQAVQGRELELSVLGNDQPAVSVAGEILAHDTFYSYQTKYGDNSPSELLIPAPITAHQLKNLQQIVIQVFTTLECRGMARVDMFMTKKGQIYVNEINTIPGFTSISMYPKLWSASGLLIEDLIDRLILLAIDDFRNCQALRNSVVELE